MSAQRPLIQTIGLFWKRSDVFWGRGSQPGSLLGVPSGHVTAQPTDFRDQTGIYVLYSDYHPVYVGQAGSGNAKLLARLKRHLKDDLSERWDRFSWYGLRRSVNHGLSKETARRAAPTNVVLDHIEAMLIHAIEPPLNRQGGRFGANVTRFLQVRDDRLGPTTDEMVMQMWSSQSH